MKFGLQKCKSLRFISNFASEITASKFGDRDMPLWQEKPIISHCHKELTILTLGTVWISQVQWSNDPHTHLSQHPKFLTAQSSCWKGKRPLRTRQCTRGIVRRALPVSPAKQQSRSGGVLLWMTWWSQTPCLHQDWLKDLFDVCLGKQAGLV